MQRIDQWVISQVANVLEEMLTDRGYGVIENDLTGGSLIEVFRIGGKLMHGTNFSSGLVCEVIVVPEKIGVKVLRSIEAGHNEKAMIIITLCKPTPPSMKMLRDMQHWCQVFEIASVIRNVTRHKLVPKHTLVPENEVANLLARWKETDRRRLPALLASDPVARYLGLSLGNVVHVEGSEGTLVGGSERYLVVKK